MNLIYTESSDKNGQGYYSKVLQIVTNRFRRRFFSAVGIIIVLLQLEK